MAKPLRFVGSVAALLLFVSCTQEYETTTITWHHGAKGFREALAAQKTDAQPILIFFHRTKCHACQFVDDAILSDLEVERAIGDLHRVRINPEDNPETAALADRFEVSRYPTLMLVASENGERYQFRTSQLDPVATFLEDLLVGLVTLEAGAKTTGNAPVDAQLRIAALP